MRRTRAKQIRKLAAKLRGGSAEPSKTYHKNDGPLLYPGGSIQGTYLSLKKRYKELCAKGKRPWLKLNKGEAF